MQKKIIGLVYEITDNPYFGSKSNLSEDRISEFPKPYELNDIARELKTLGFEIDVIDGAKGLLERMEMIRKHCCLIFNKSIGYRGLERKIVVPAICQLYNLPLLGSTAYGMTIARHKYHTNRLLAGCGMKVPGSLLAFEGHVPDNEEIAHLQLPVIVKPNHESDSLGIDVEAICKDLDAIKKRVCYVHNKFKQAAIVEEFIGGEEWKIAIMGNLESARSLGCVGVMKSGEKMSGSLQTRQDVVKNTLTYYRPSNSPAVHDAMDCAVKVHRMLGLRDYSRCDFRLAENGSPICMEVSTHPDLDQGCSFAAAALQSLSSHRKVIQELVRTAMIRENIPLPND